MGDEAVRELSAELVRQHRLTQLMRDLMAGWAPGNLDWGASGLLACLVKGGPKRQGDLAGTLLLDPSTISRRVQQLVRLGYVERRADPVDGRAVQLVATRAGEDVFSGIVRRRDEVMQHVLGRWPEEDVEVFLRLVRRFNDDVETYRPLLSATRAGDPLPEYPTEPVPA